MTRLNRWCQYCTDRCIGLSTAGASPVSVLQTKWQSSDLLAVAMVCDSDCKQKIGVLINYQKSAKRTPWQTLELWEGVLWMRKLAALFLFRRRRRCKNVKCFPFAREVKPFHPTLPNPSPPVVRLWGQFCFENVTGAALVRQHLVPSVKWPLWESRTCSKWFQMLNTLTRTHALLHTHAWLCWGLWGLCWHWKYASDCV